MNVLYFKISRFLGITQVENDVQIVQDSPQDSAQTESTIERRKRRNNAFAQWGHALSTFKTEVRSNAARTEVRLSHGSGWNDIAHVENGAR